MRVCPHYKDIPFRDFAQVSPAKKCENWNYMLSKGEKAPAGMSAGASEVFIHSCFSGFTPQHVLRSR